MKKLEISIFSGVYYKCLFPNLPLPSLESLKDDDIKAVLRDEMELHSCIAIGGPKLADVLLKNLVNSKVKDRYRMTHPHEFMEEITRRGMVDSEIKPSVFFNKAGRFCAEKIYVFMPFFVSICGVS